MRVLMVSWAWRSHYFPLVSLGWALRSAGHEVLVATQPALVDVVVGSGLPAASVGHDIDIAEVIRRAVGRLEPARPDRAWWDAVTAKMRECLGIFLTPAEAMADDTVALAERWRPDLVVYEPSSYVGPLVAGVLGVPAVRHLWGPDVFGRFAGLEQENLAPLAHRFGLTTIDPIGDLTIDPCPPSLQLPGDYRRQIVRYIPYNGPALSPEWLADAPAAYRTYVAAQVDDTLAKTKKFAAAVTKGDVTGAKALYAPSRVGWERIEPVAESFGDIDPKVDTRAADLASGQRWTGWHQIEKALWKDGSLKGEAPYATQLVKDLETLKARVGTASITATSMANGAKELLDEVATSKVTGEEETYSHTDLVDFKANVDGAQKVYELLKPVVAQRDAALAAALDDEFAKVDRLLARYARGDGYVSYDTVGEQDRKTLSDEVNALGEPLSKLAGVVAR